ncbi:ABC transporter ATP-binding protein [Paenibacillus soyae]|uniref:ABC transporter ATP-binding protein n=1 Tax=Paenibacillus soyae TaxID=2969249 RepID=A0A9X2MRK0_9BACL|nr:ABC transporter ATP-binding protein [Paenibacillus soyae]MCR2804947.1 ABC transporter ATP-binding protein [Paenibacillus soyae]
MLEVRRVSKTFEGKRGVKEVLKDVSLRVAEGEFVSLVGPSGSGKTTLFSVIGGLEKPTSGEVHVGGRETTGETGHVAYMPQQASLLPWRTVAGNIELSLTIAGVAKKKAREDALEWLRRIGLDAYADAYPHVLSGGMQQRVSFLRALLSPQRLMLLDEPFGALDALTRGRMQKWLLSLWEQNRRSVLLVTHSIEEALYLSDRILVLSSSPAVLVEEIVVPFERPRREELWEDARFMELRGRIYRQLEKDGGEEADHG